MQRNRSTDNIVQYNQEMFAQSFKVITCRRQSKTNMRFPISD